MQDNLFSFLSLAFSYELIHSIKLLIAIRRSGLSCAWDCAILEQWTVTARGIMRFLGAGLLPRVELRNSRAMDCYRAWNYAISGRWTVTARGIMRFLGAGLFPRVELRTSRAMDCSRAWNYAISGRWTVPARGIAQFSSDGLFPRVGLCDF